MSQHGISIRYIEIDKVVFTPITNCTKTEQVSIHGSTTHQTLCNKTISDRSNNVMANSVRIHDNPVNIPNECPGSGYILETDIDVSGSTTLKWSKHDTCKCTCANGKNTPSADDERDARDERIDASIDELLKKVRSLELETEQMKNDALIARAQLQEVTQKNSELTELVNVATGCMNRASDEIIRLHKSIAELSARIGHVDLDDLEIEETRSKLNYKTAKKIMAESMPYIDGSGNIVISGDISSVLGAALAIIESKIAK